MIQTNTYVDAKIYRNVQSTREAVHSQLREIIKRVAEANNDEILWHTETIESVLITGNWKCEDRLLVTMKVEIA